MTTEPAALLAVGVYLAGVASGYWLAKGPPRPPAPAPAPPPPPAERWLDAGRELARQALGQHGQEHGPSLDALGSVIARRMAEAYGEGVSDLRGALVASSALPPGVIDQAASVAIGVLGRRG